MVSGGRRVAVDVHEGKLSEGRKTRTVGALRLKDLNLITIKS